MELSLLELSQNIHYYKTKEYFQEVIKTYDKGSYRSAISVLYTVVICDLIYKLNDLKDIYNDPKALQILDDLEKGKIENPVSPEWEEKLIEKVFFEGKMIDNDVYTHILALKKDRNLSVHPVLNSTNILFHPTKDLTKAHIRTMLEGILTQHPFLNNKVFGPFMDELARIESEFPTHDRLKTYLDSKFFKFFNKDVIKYVFKHLWKSVYSKSGENEKKYREINFRVLQLILEENTDLMLNYISDSASFFSIFLDSDKTILKYLIKILYLYPTIYEKLEPHAKEIIKNRVDQNYKLKPLSYFLSESVPQHFRSLIRSFNGGPGMYFNQPYTLRGTLSNDDIKCLEKLAKSNDCLDIFYELLINQYFHSSTFDTADILFDSFISPYYKNFKKDHFELLFSGANENPQCYGRKYGAPEHKKLLSVAKALYEDDFNFLDAYENIF
jgi:hypothetical protein